MLLTKSDKLARGPAKATLLGVRRKLDWFPGATVQLFSALNGAGIDEVRAVLDKWYTGPCDDAQ